MKKGYLRIVVAVLLTIMSSCNDLNIKYVDINDSLIDLEQNQFESFCYKNHELDPLLYMDGRAREILKIFDPQNIHFMRYPEPYKPLEDHIMVLEIPAKSITQLFKRKDKRRALMRGVWLVENEKLVIDNRVYKKDSKTAIFSINDGVARIFYKIEILKDSLRITSLYGNPVEEQK